MDILLFSTLYLSALLLPGYAVHSVSNLKSPGFLNSVAISVSLFAIFFIFGNYFGLKPSFVLTAELSILAISALYVARHICKRNVKISKHLLPVITVIIASGVYQLIFGSLIEMPADLFAHMERYQYARIKLQEGSLGYNWNLQQLLLQRSNVSYFYTAGISLISGTSTDTVIHLTDYLNRTLFLIATYFFSQFIFSNNRHSQKIAGLATILVAIHFGTGVFAYIRYYSAAPTMINMTIYMAAVALFLSTIKEHFSVKHLYLYVLIGLLTAAASIIHVQEAMFIATMGAIIATIGFCKSMLSSKLRDGAVEIDAKQFAAITIGAGIAITSAYIYSHTNLERAANAHWRLWEFSQGFGLIPAITTLNLKFQFAQVITLWGLFVYGLFFLNFKRYRNNLFVIAGMLSPAFTILNPFFVDLFMRHNGSTTLWRLCYLIPIHLVAADLFIFYLGRLKETTILTKASSTLVITILVLLLLPFANTWHGVHYNRFPTLGKADPVQSYRYNQDLLTYLSTLGSRYEILTDPMTGYMVSALTKHYSARRKFFRDYRFKHFTFEDYSNSPLEKYKGHLLIVNQREYGESELGRISGHWAPAEWRNLRYYYTDPLLKHLASNPTKFEKSWSKNGITVYYLKP